MIRKDLKVEGIMKRIESEQNASVKQWKKLYTKKEREKTRTYLIEGPHLIEEAIKHDVPVIHLIVEESFELPGTWDAYALNTWVVTRKIMKGLSDTEHPQGILAVCEMPDEEETLEPKGRFLLVDGVQDPGNLGTIIRTADSAGLNGVILGEGTVDLYNSKVLRATQGSLFHLPVIKGHLSKWISSFKEEGVPVYITALKGATSMREVASPEQFALVIGNEGSGVRSEIMKEADELVAIPIYGQAESLNVSVATGILLYELQRNRK
ncbi:TrmH family RNA methyltransferase [Fictibacillus sp. Mic-4]|uniref:TrmH family RNA methyltransferase n=1 Tax=Fictibacillus sp. Mic-4 TaxID=3132826 RepID=UPI003CF26BD5